MGKPYSDELRERVIAAIDAGHTREAKLSELVLAIRGAENKLARVEDLSDEELERLRVAQPARKNVLRTSPCRCDSGVA